MTAYILQRRIQDAAVTLSSLHPGYVSYITSQQSHACIESFCTCTDSNGPKAGVRGSEILFISQQLRTNGCVQSETMYMYMIQLENHSWIGAGILA